MKNISFLISILLLIACDNNRKTCNDFQKDQIFTVYNSILTFDCIEDNIDTVTIQELVHNDSMSFFGVYIIPASNGYYLKTRISYLNDHLIKNRVPGHYGRNSKHLTFYLFGDSLILFSNDYLLYDTISIKDISEIVQEYYFEEKKHLKYEVEKEDKGVDLKIYENVNPIYIQILIDSLSVSYINIINRYSKITFGKEFKMLSTSEVLKFLNAINLSTEITISTIQSPYLY